MRDQLIKEAVIKILEILAVTAPPEDVTNTEGESIPAQYVIDEIEVQSCKELLTKLDPSNRQLEGSNNLAQLTTIMATIKTNWQEIGCPLPPEEQRMKMTSENYYKIIAMRDELIFEQKDEIAMLKMKINQLQLKLKRL